MLFLYLRADLAVEVVPRLVGKHVVALRDVVRLRGLLSFDLARVVVVGGLVHDVELAHLYLEVLNLIQVGAPRVVELHRALLFEVAFFLRGHLDSELLFVGLNGLLTL